MNTMYKIKRQNANNNKKKNACNKQKCRRTRNIKIWSEIGTGQIEQKQSSRIRLNCNRDAGSFRWFRHTISAYQGLLSWYTLVPSWSGCSIPSGIHTESPSSCAAPCPATGESSGYLSAWCSGQLNLYVGHHFHVAAKKCPPVLCLSSTTPVG